VNSPAPVISPVVGPK